MICYSKRVVRLVSIRARQSLECARFCSAIDIQATCSSSILATDPLHIHVHNSKKWPTNLLEQLLADCQVQAEFVNEEEEQILLTEMEPHLKRMRWEKDHWDDQIHYFREREQNDWLPTGQPLIDRILRVAFPPLLRPSPYVHVLDLHAQGHIRAHLDKDRYCGRVIAGLSLMSASVMRLRHQNVELREQFVADLLLSRRSLYRLSGVARYEFTHELLADAESVFNGRRVPRERRVALICRELPLEEKQETN